MRVRALGDESYAHGQRRLCVIEESNTGRLLAVTWCAGATLRNKTKTRQRDDTDLQGGRGNKSFANSDHKFIVTRRQMPELFNARHHEFETAHPHHVTSECRALLNR